MELFSCVSCFHQNHNDKRKPRFSHVQGFVLVLYLSLNHSFSISKMPRLMGAELAVIVGYGAGRPGVLVPAGARHFSLLQNRPDDLSPGFDRRTVRPGRNTD